MINFNSTKSNIVKYKVMQFVLLACIVLMFSNCEKEKLYKQFAKDSANFVNKYTDDFIQLNIATAEIAKQLLANLKNHKQGKKIAITSFVNLNDLSTTTSGGRLLAESMINELHKRKFGIVDYRGQNAVVVNKAGEFHLTRNSNDLKGEIDDTYIFVATFFAITDKSIVINARIMDSYTGDILSTAQILHNHQHCELFNSCKPVVVKKVLPPAIIVRKKIYIEDIDEAD